MTSKTDGIKRYRISDRKRRLIVRCFVVDCTAVQTAQIVGINRNTVNRYYALFRKILVNHALKERRKSNLGNGIEIDESYFGPKRVKGKRGRGASKKIIVLGLLKRNGQVYTQIIPNTKREEIMPIIRRTVKKGSDIYTDGWRSYDALAVYGYNHKKVQHDKDEFAVGETHINGVESFWSYAKRRLTKFNGIRKQDFARYMLESEWRFNHRNTMEKTLKQLL